ncbi:hypothetical protein Ppa06_57310 [Planomonospora parontospora subsp. parontospora]|uniref:Uncharacterized protein n=2 Tax=Planomonospora parontospora TaxID=58119 RepID=A0AA37BLX7_9ACTN|nr:hypothetical protein [Planomonospora parontospora]GGK90925.1 hypothetical protein GCM10010126_57990 [Planomonospora parontospora]GII11933.1 hypothetical protein Ppa06_57310 [Planomonospora parontospora subsp. parontospora]
MIERLYTHATPGNPDGIDVVHLAITLPGHINSFGEMTVEGAVFTTEFSGTRADHDFFKGGCACDVRPGSTCPCGTPSIYDGETLYASDIYMPHHDGSLAEFVRAHETSLYNDGYVRLATPLDLAESSWTYTRRTGLVTEEIEITACDGEIHENGARIWAWEDLPTDAPDGEQADRAASMTRFLHDCDVELIREGYMR